MLSFAPVLLAQLLLFGWLVRRRQPLRIAFLTACCGWGALVVLFSEAASVACAVTRPVLATLWWTTCAVLLICSDPRATRAALREALGRAARRTTAGEASVGIALLVVLGLLAVVALCSAPNSWDGHGYHLARVRHWIQNRSIAHFPTNIERQIDVGPWAELAILQLELLGGSDRFAAGVQWYAMVVAATASSVIAWNLGASRGGQILAGVATVTLPMGMLQASSTQNDLVVAGWLSASLALALTAVRREASTEWLIIPAGACLGLAILTKGTAYPFAAPFVVWIVIRSVRTRGLASLRWLIVAGGLALVLNLPHYVRNVAASGSPLGPGFVVWNGRVLSYTNERISIGGTISNVLRSAALQLAAPDLDHLLGAAPLDRLTSSIAGRLALPPARAWNDGVVAATAALLRALGEDPDDPATTWNGGRFRIPPAGWNFEDTAGNLLHAVLFAASLPVLVVAARRERRRDTLALVACCAAGVILFNAAFAWQVYHSRLYLPVFVLLCASFGVAGSGLTGRWATAVAGMLIAAAVPWLVNNQTRPLLGEHSILRVPRFVQYFHQVPTLERAFVASAEMLRRAQCRQVLLRIANEAWEYPLWVALDHVGWQTTIRHGGIANYTAQLVEPCCATPPPPPCAEVDVTMAGVQTRLLASSTSE